MNGDVNNSKVQNGKALSDSTETVQKTQNKSNEPEKGQWENKAEMMLSCIGLSVGLGNIWRFPYLAYRHGGAAFVIAYIILQLLIGKPMYMMELVMGQFSGLGPTAVWKMNPCAKGVGISMAIISLVVAIYYNVITAYTLYYLFASMQKVLPWTVCPDEWLAFGCVEKTQKKLAHCTGNSTVDQTKCLCSGNYTFDSMYAVNCTNSTNVPSAELYFEKTVIQKGPGMNPDQIGDPIWQLALCLLLAWILVIVCLVKGIKSSGKVVYFTATFPYVVLLILLIRGCLLDGAIDGVKYFIIPEWDKLRDLEVWVAAAGQMFFSLGVSFGGIIMYGSYTKFTNNVYGDSLIIASMDLITSLIAGFVIFTTFGGMAKQIGVEVKDVAKGGYGLAFVAYPEALTNLPVTQLWSILFFFMLFTLGLDSEFALLETTMTCIQDEWPILRKYKTHMCIVFGVGLYFLALPCITPAGDYIVTLMDYYGSDFSVLLVAACECIGVMWIYGVRRFINDCTYMLGRPPHLKYFWMFCWTIPAPLVIGALFIYRIISDNPPEITKGVPFPHFAQSIGWALTVFVLIPIPTVFVYTFCKAKGNFIQRLRTITTPTSDWGPNDGKERDTLEDVFDMERKYGLDNMLHL